MRFGDWLDVFSSSAFTGATAVAFVAAALTARSQFLHGERAVIFVVGAVVGMEVGRR